MSTFYSKVIYSGDGSTTQFSVPFPYIDRTHVKVYLDSVEVTAWSWLTDATIEMDTAPASSEILTINRETPRDSRMVDFQNASNLTEEILDMDANQVFFITQEFVDVEEASLGLSVDGTSWDADNKKLVNLAPPVNASDATTREWVEALEADTRDWVETWTLERLPTAASIIQINRDPTLTDDVDDEYVIGQRWVNTATGTAWVLVDNTSGAAVWRSITNPEWQVVSSNYTAKHADRLLVNVSGGAVTITLPASPSTGDWVELACGGGSYSNNNLIVARNGETIMGLAENMTVNVDNVSVVMVYNGSTWRIA